MFFDVARLVGEPERVVPLVERIIEAHFQAFSANRVSKVSGEVTLWADLDGVPRAAPGGRSFFAGPQRKALVVLRRERDILGSGAGENVSPVIGIEELGAELRSEVLIGSVGAVPLLMIGPGAGLDGGRFRI